MGLKQQILIRSPFWGQNSGIKVWTGLRSLWRLRGGSFNAWGLQGPLARGRITPVSVCVFTGLSPCLCVFPLLFS